MVWAGKVRKGARQVRLTVRGCPGPVRQPGGGRDGAGGPLCADPPVDLGGNAVVDAAPLGDAGRLVWLRLSGNRLATLDASAG